MPKVRVHTFNISLDGYGAGPNQSLENPLGEGGPHMFGWFFATRTFNAMHGGEGGSTDIDDSVAARGFENVGAWILGRNMFGPVRGPWLDDSWKGWWGEEPPYHTPAFVLTHHKREPLVMKGGTTFHFVTGGIHEALERARKAAQEKDVRIGGGVATVRSYLRAGLIDELQLTYSPVLLGAGEPALEGISLPALGYQHITHIASPNALHVTITKQSL
jgi:dihydrofolate reductase